MKIRDLPQGLLEGGLLPQEGPSEGPVYPTVIQQARMNMRKFENCVVLTRMGGFYEAGFPFFQLERFLKILVQDLNKYVAISEEFPNNASEKVKSGGLLFDRKVTRVITPGTLVDEKFMDPFENNFILAIYPEPLDHENLVRASEMAEGSTLPVEAKQYIGLAWLDLSTGAFFTQVTTLDVLASGLARIRAREIVLSKIIDHNMKQFIFTLLGHEQHLVTWLPGLPTDMSITDWHPMLETPLSPAERAIFTEHEVLAGNILLEYVSDKLQGRAMKLQPPVKRHETENMCIDRNSLRGLEILETLRDAAAGGRGSLLHTIRRTVTKSGARLLRERLASPSMSLDVINHRLDLVDRFLQNQSLGEDISNLLRRTFDSQRLVQKFSLGRGDADDLISLLKTVVATEHIANVLGEALSQEYGSDVIEQDTKDCLSLVLESLSLKGPGEVALRISETIDEDGLIASHREERIQSSGVITMAQGILNEEGDEEDLQAMSQVIRSKTVARPSIQTSGEEEDLWIMRRTASSILERLHETLDSLRAEKLSLATQLRSELEAQSLTLRWTPGLGHICHVKGVKDVRASLKNHGSARNGSTTKSTRAFYLSEWSTLGGRMDQVKMQMRAEEQRVFFELRELVVTNLVKLRRNAAVLDELDVACSSAVLAAEQRLVRPILNNGTNHKIIAGRHPTVTLGLEEQGRAFISNDCFVGEKQNIWLITGPNMAGKSTFLRQNALISILAQVGSFVPAEHAEIGIVDQMFSRVGSADNLFEDQSTFMVEMLETATILKHATPRSFVIMDEVGRGTTPEDGIAVAFASLHHLYHMNHCRTLFATHFHVLADMTNDWKGLSCYCTDVSESSSGSFSYVHRLRHGVNRKSHALKVAKLAALEDMQKHTAASDVTAPEVDLPVGSSGNVRTTIFKPATVHGDLPFALYTHGGCETSSANPELPWFFHFTPPAPDATYPTQFEESYAILSNVFEHGSDYGLKTNKVALMGESAGGHMALAISHLAATRSGPPVVYQVLLYRVTDTSSESHAFVTYKYGLYLSVLLLRSMEHTFLPNVYDRSGILASPLLMSKADLQKQPPTLIVTCAVDPLQAEGEASGHALQQAEVWTAIFRTYDVIHDFVMLNETAGVKRVWRRLS
ncbi:DNA mismatch repair ATPase msh1 [Xylographa trunciseda]|nr:DNA mismatch repair ATPase msh1 [Xylographa trunciseda]